MSLNRKGMGPLSADGGKLHRMQQEAHDMELPNLDEEVHEVENEQEEMSLEVNLNERIGQRDGGTAISERPDESSRNSTPPGTVGGDIHDVRSEQHTAGAALHRFGQRPGKLTKFAQDIGDNSSADDSARATKSVNTKVTAVAMVSTVVPLPENGGPVSAFKMGYSQLFEDFKHKLVEEYGKMRCNYMQDYQSNYENNTSRTQEKISEAQSSIENKESQVSLLEEIKDTQKKRMNGFFTKQYNRTLYKTAWHHWNVYRRFQSRKNRVAAYTTNNLRRRKLRLLFGSWRGVSHEWFKERMQSQKEVFRKELETKMLVQWSSKVDHLLVYMAQLEEKIKLEQTAREQLTTTYEQSLNVGVNKLNTETNLLAEDPLVREISLIVAKELMKSGKTNGQLADLMRQRSHDKGLIEEVFQTHANTRQ